MNRTAVIDAIDSDDVVEATDAYDGIAKVKETDDKFIAVIYSADHMEDDGKRFISELRAEDNASSIDAIALVSQDGGSTTEDAIQAGADIAFVRPFDIAELQKRILKAQA